ANTMRTQPHQIRHWSPRPHRGARRAPAGKVAKPIVKEAASARTSGAPGAAPASARDSSLIELIALISGDPSMMSRRPDAKANLSADLKLDSLGRVQLLGALEDRYQIELDEAALTPETTLGDLERMIHGVRRVEG